VLWVFFSNSRSQNHRMLQVGRDLWRSSGPSPGSSRATYSQLSKIPFRQFFNISTEGDSTSSVGSLYQCSVTLRVRKHFLTFRGNLLCFCLCPLPLTCHWAPLKSQMQQLSLCIPPSTLPKSSFPLISKMPAGHYNVYTC